MVSLVVVIFSPLMEGLETHLLMLGIWYRYGASEIESNKVSPSKGDITTMMRAETVGVRNQ